MIPLTIHPTADTVFWSQIWQIPVQNHDPLRIYHPVQNILILLPPLQMQFHPPLCPDTLAFYLLPPWQVLCHIAQNNLYQSVTLSLHPVFQSVHNRSAYYKSDENTHAWVPHGCAMWTSPVRKLQLPRRTLCTPHEYPPMQTMPHCSDNHRSDHPWK